MDHKEIYYIGIIDILTQFNFKKKCEYMGKLMIHFSHKMSCVPPKMYNDRFLKYMENKVFPKDIEAELLATLHDPGASSCAEESLMRVLRRYDPKAEGQMLVEEIPAHGLFKMKDGRIFKKGEKLRKRYRCQQKLSTRRFDG